MSINSARIIPRIFKLQRSIYDTDGRDLTLAYDKHEKFRGQFETPDAFKEIFNEFGPKVFVRATLTKNNQLDIKAIYPPDHFDW